MKETVQIAKEHILYKASEKNCSKNVSLKKCLVIGSPKQNLIWDILNRSRFRPILLCGDLPLGKCTLDNVKEMYCVVKELVVTSQILRE